MNLSTEQKQTQRHKEQTCSCQGVKGIGRKDWKVGASKCKLIYRMDKQQGPIIYHRKLYSISYYKPEWKNMNIYTHTHTHTHTHRELNHFAVQQKLTQHCKSTRLQ